MGCMQSVPNEISDKEKNDQKNVDVVVPDDVSTQPIKHEVPVGLVGLTSTAVMGARTHGAVAASEIPLKRKRSLVLKSDNKEDDDIEIAKHGEHYILHGTRAVMDINMCEVIGSIENGVFVKECSDYIKSICDKYKIQFKK